MKDSAPTLRTGFTTGSAATAAAVAAYLRLSTPVSIILPRGGTLDISIARLWENGAAVIKDGGDDPDVTSGCEICVELTEFDGVPADQDYTEMTEGLELVIRGGTGVGVATRPGLAVPPGKAAINPAPRKMLLTNLLEVGCRGRYLLTISVPRGAAAAAETMNPTLGIKGGISILGNSGIVYPYSNAAYAATIVLMLKSCAAGGARRVVLVTGNRSESAVKRDFPEFSDEQIIRIGDFIHTAVKSAKKSNFEYLTVACMPGKLFKYACGEKNTHAHNSKLKLSRLNDFGVSLPQNVKTENMDTMGELRTALDAEIYLEVLEKVYAQAYRVLQEWAGSTSVKLLLYDDKGERLL